MLSKTQMVAVRVAIEKTYIGTCNVIQYEEVINSDKTTGFEEVVELENQPCRLSFESTTKAEQGSGATSIGQGVKVFLSPDPSIVPGSKVVVTQNEQIFEYKSSGEPAVYSSHQEVVLELFEDWS